MAGSAPERLLGVRDAFLRYFNEGLQKNLSVAVVPQASTTPAGTGLALGDAEVMAAAHRQAAQLQERLGDTYHFYIATEGGVTGVELAGQTHYFVRNWTVILSSVGESWGGSGSVELPASVVASVGDEPPNGMPGTRRRGGIISSLTGGLETRRKAVSLSTFHALSTLFYGVLQSRSVSLG